MDTQAQGEVTGTLESWYYDGWRNVVWGRIYGDTKKRFADGLLIHTSDIDNLANKLKKGYLLKTMNSVYLLGEPLTLKIEERKYNESNL